MSDFDRSLKLARRLLDTPAQTKHPTALPTYFLETVLGQAQHNDYYLPLMMVMDSLIRTNIHLNEPLLQGAVEEYARYCQDALNERHTEDANPASNNIIIFPLNRECAPC